MMKSVDNLESTKQAFEHWRQTRRNSTEQIPAELRQQAVALCDRYPITQIARTLRLNHQALLSWRRQTANPEFVSLDLSLPAPTPFSAPARMVLVHPKGCRLELSGLDRSDVSQLINQFVTA